MGPGIGRNSYKEAMQKAKAKTNKPDGGAPSTFRMRRQGGEIGRATETSDLAYSENQIRTMGNMGMPGTVLNDGHSTLNYGTTPMLKPDDDKKKTKPIELDEVVVSAPSVETLNKKAQHLVANTTQFQDRDQIQNQGLRNVAKGSNSRSLQSLSPKNAERLNRALTGASGTRTVEMMKRANKRKEGLL